MRGGGKLQYISSEPMKGFTLIEVLMTITLIMLVTGAGLVSFNTTSRRERLNGGMEKVRQAMLQAKANARSGVKDCQACGADPGQNYACGTGDTSLQGWRVTFFQNAPPTPDAFRVEGLCSNTDYPGGAQTVFYQRDENLPDSVEMAVGGGSMTSILFRPKGGGIYPVPTLPSPPTSWNRTINFSYGPEPTKTVRVNSAGEVQ